MVELKLETMEEGLPKDCYLSVRVGEVQKLSRLSGAKSFKFPPNSKSRFGKIEVFRRIGSASVDLDPEFASVERQVNISIEGGATEYVPLKVAVMAPDARPPPAAPADDAAAKTSAKARAAKEYLGKHQLEVKLAEAMQAVLRERPDDPIGYLAAKLAKVAGQPPLAVPAKTAKATPGPVAILPFGAYFTTYFGAAGPSCMEQIYARFPAPKKVAAAPKKLALTNFREYYMGAFLSVQPADAAKMYQRFAVFNECAKKAAPKKLELTNFGEYYRGAFLSVQPPDAAKMYQRFAIYNECAKKAAPAGAPKASFKMKPSVGTWIMAKPRVWLGGASAAVSPPRAAAAKPGAAAAANFAKRPSVGTWLTPLFVRPGAAAAAPKAAASAKMAASSPAAKRARMLLPSVGTWLAPRTIAYQRPRVDAVRCLRGLQGGRASPDQRREAERVLTKALLEMTGDFEGEYYPLAGSDSFPMVPGGMSKPEELTLETRGLLFKPNTGDTAGRGVFANAAQDVVAWVNEDDRVRFMVFHTGPAAANTLLRFQQAVEAALKQDGYTLV